VTAPPAWWFALQGLGYGFAAASQPGPFQTYLISQSLARGWRHTLPAALAPLLSDGPIIVLCLLVLTQLPPWMERVLYLAGGVFIVYLALGAYRAWRRFDLAAPLPPGGGQSVLRAAGMNVLSPGPYIFWSLVTGPILVAAWHGAHWNGALFLAGFYSAMVACLAALILVFGLAARAGPRVNRAMQGVSSLALLLFGLYQLARGLQLVGN